MRIQRNGAAERQADNLLAANPDAEPVQLGHASIGTGAKVQNPPGPHLVTRGDTTEPSASSFSKYGLLQLFENRTSQLWGFAAPDPRNVP